MVAASFGTCCQNSLAEVGSFAGAAPRLGPQRIHLTNGMFLGQIG
jgi:hypothetical protein